MMTAARQGWGTRALTAATMLAAALALQGCAAPLGLAALEIGASTTASAGVSHTMGGITYKTFTASQNDVHTATRKALTTMGIAVDSDQPDPTTRTIKAHASERDIDIEIESLTPKTTRLRVVASEDVVFKDSATATEIIIQTAQALDDLPAARTRPSRAAKSRS